MGLLCRTFHGKTGWDEISRPLEGDGTELENSRFIATNDGMRREAHLRKYDGTEQDGKRSVGTGQNVKSPSCAIVTRKSKNHPARFQSCSVPSLRENEDLFMRFPRCPVPSSRISCVATPKCAATETCVSDAFTHRQSKESQVWIFFVICMTRIGKYANTPQDIFIFQ